MSAWQEQIHSSLEAQRQIRIVSFDPGTCTKAKRFGSCCCVHVVLVDLDSVRSKKLSAKLTSACKLFRFVHSPLTSFDIVLVDDAELGLGRFAQSQLRQN